MVFKNTIPQASDRLLTSQQDLLNNNAQLETSFSVDHVGYTDATGDTGLHKQITYQDKVTPSAPTGDQSVLYSEAGSASTDPFLKFQNANATLPVSGLRAFCVFNATTGTGAKTVANGFNVSNVNRVSATQFTITLASNVTSGTDYVVIPVSTGSNVAVSSINRSAGSFTVDFSSSADNRTIHLMVLQA